MKKVRTLLFLSLLVLNSGLIVSCSGDTKTHQLNSGECEAKRCKGKTQEDKRCKNETKNCNHYCHLHQEQAN